MPSQPFPVPKRFAIDLREFDNLLRVRWDPKNEYWRIERKGYWGTYDMDNPADRDAKAEGYVIVLRVPPDCLQWYQVKEALYLTDIKRRGGARAVWQEMEAREAHNKRVAQAAWQDEVEYKAKERWTSWNTNYPVGKRRGIPL